MTAPGTAWQGPAAICTLLPWFISLSARRARRTLALRS